MTMVPGTGRLPIDPIARSYAHRAGGACALTPWATSHLLLAIVALGGLLCLGSRGPEVLLAFVVLGLSACLALVVAFRLAAMLISAIKAPGVEAPGSAGDLDLPVYTLIVPLYREANVARSIVAALSGLEYPRELLDIKLVLEADDLLTASAIGDLELGPEYDVMTLEPTHPRTKPKACCRGLEAARGRYVVIYDAEDRPESDQLLKAARAFGGLPPDVACLQAKLNFYNPRENFLTRCFAIEYAAWFDLTLPGLQWLGSPIPLGGTSNHFRVDALRGIGAWDPYNVTEDCDLGVRLAIRGYRTLILESTTWEEATNSLGNWTRQRSRWAKGYMQTYLVHTKHPLRLMQRLGVIRTAYFLLAVGGVTASQLIVLPLMPTSMIYIMALLVDIAQGRDAWTVIAGDRAEYRVAWKMLFLGPGEDPSWASLSVATFCASVAMLLANGLVILGGLFSCSRRAYSDLWVTALCAPAYWILASLATWRGLIQLFRNPHHWEKTAHGLSDVPPDPNLPAGVPRIEPIRVAERRS